MPKRSDSTVENKPVADEPMANKPSRRRLFQGAAAAAAVQTFAASEASAAPRSGFPLKIAKGLRDVSDETLNFFLQMGVEYVTMPSRFNIRRTKRGLVPGTDRGPQSYDPVQPLDADELIKIKSHLAARGLKAEMVRLPRSWRVLHGKPGAADDIKAMHDVDTIVSQGRVVKRKGDLLI